MRPLPSSVICGALIAVCAGNFAFADKDEGFKFSAEVEVGIEAIRNTDDPDDEVTDIFLSGELEAEVALGERITAFADLTFESVTDAEQSRTFQDIGLYVGEIGFSIDLDPVTLNVGKISPAFGSAWDTAPGYFGADFAEDYELEEQIGAIVEVDLGDGMLGMSVFYADDTRLSDSWGTHRGRNNTNAGGAGNTGKLNNVALQYDHEFDATTVHVGARFLSRGEGDDKDERGVVLGLTHGFSDDIEVIAEVAQFDGWEGTAESAFFATIGASLVYGPFMFSAALSRRDVTSAPMDHLMAFGLDYAFENGVTLSTGYAVKTEDREKTDSIAVSLVVPLN